MRNFKNNFTDITWHIKERRKPDFNNILKVLDRGKPERPVLFEFFLNDRLYSNLSGVQWETCETDLDRLRLTIKSFEKAGYDYATIHGSSFTFPSNRHHDTQKKTISINSGAVIYDRESFKNYEWPNPDNYDFSRIDTLAPDLAEGMKFIIAGPGGVLENVIQLVGYDSLCYMIADDPDLVQEIFNEVGSRLVRYYEKCSPCESVGALISNDDWGFNTQTMLSLQDMRKYVFPWHKKIVEVIHAAGKHAILHSCGNLEHVMEDVIADMKFDAKHSYEDNIMPVEQAYERWGSKIAIMGGIDVDFLCRSTPEQVYKRSAEMFERSTERGSYALGSGNSIPRYVPDENYFAMIAASK